MVEIDSAVLFMVGAVAIMVGYVSNLIFRKYKVPDILLIMLFGWIVGPSALGIISSGTNDLIDTLIPYVSSLALAFIMFNGGLELDIPEIWKVGRLVSTLSMVMLSLVIISLSLFFFLVLGLPIAMAILAGVVFGSTSAPTIIPLIMNMGCSTRIKTILTLESAITDVSVVGIGSAIVILLGSSASSISGAVLTLTTSILLATIIGIGAGIVWLYSTAMLRKHRYYYMLTLAMILLIYSLCEFVAPAGGGVIAVLLFGLLLSNVHNFHFLPGLDHAKVKIDKEFHMLNEEASFFIKVFFFTFLGLYVSTLNITGDLLLYGLIVIGILFLIRLLMVHLLSGRNHWKRSEVTALRLMFPRGLCTVVVALLPFTEDVAEGIEKNTLLGIVALVVIGTTLLTSLGAWLVEKQLPGEVKAEEAEAPLLPDTGFNV